MPEQQAHKQDADDRSRLDVGNPDVGDQIPEADDRKDQQDRVFAEQHKDINCTAYLQLYTFLNRKLLEWRAR
jgi:hypothetical protein